jgi:recombining binding protein suppressor of hairless
MEKKQLTREAMKRYLRERNDLSITIYHPKVAQKSYGTEKRFFCPPPCVYLKGWENKQQTLMQAGYSAEQSELCAFIGIGGTEKDMQILDTENKVTYFEFV